MRQWLQRRSEPPPPEKPAPARVTLKGPYELGLMRTAGQIVAEVHETVRQAIKPGVTTGELNRLADALIRKRNGVPSFLGYNGFPASICASINDELVHGIPSAKRVLKASDIISVDVGVIYKGFHGDSAWTYPVGEITDEAKRLLAVTEQSLYVGIEQVAPGKTFGDVSGAIQRYVEGHGFSVVREYTGHGIGRQMHEDPQILHYLHPDDKVQYWILRPGMTFAIEPMVNVGTWKTQVLEDGWTVVPEDRRLSAHFEHTLAVTENGVEILTRQR